MRDFLMAIQSMLFFRRLSWRQLHIITIFLVLGFPVIVDLITGFMIQVVSADLSLGIIYRGAFLALLTPSFFYLNRAWTRLYLLLLLGLWLVCNLLWMETTREYFLFREISLFAKVLYAWVIYAYLAVVLKRFDIPLEYAMNCMIFFGAVAALSIIFSYLTGYGLSTYERSDAFAVKSYFKAQNDIGLAILMTLPVCLYFFVRYGKWFYGGIGLVIVAGLVLLGTRAGLMGGFAALGAYLGLYLLAAVDFRKRSGKRMLLVGVMLVSFFVVVYYAAVSIGEYRYLVEKYTEIFEETPRETLEIAASNQLKKRSDLHNVIGEGTVSFRVGVFKYYPNKEKQGSDTKDFSFGKQVEQDILDMIGAYGLLLGGLILLTYAALLLKIGVAVAIGRDLLGFTFGLSMAFYIFHAFLAGHALGSAVVATPAGLVIYYIVERVRLPAIRVFSTAHSPLARSRG